MILDFILSSFSFSDQSTERLYASASMIDEKPPSSSRNAGYMANVNNEERKELSKIPVQHRVPISYGHRVDASIQFPP